MKEEVKVLTKEEAANISSIFGNKKAMSAYFGKWGKKDAKTSYIIDWCDERLDEYRKMIANLELLQSEMIDSLLQTRKGLKPAEAEAAKEVA